VGNLLVLVIPQEGFDVELQPVVEEPVLRPQRVGGQIFGLRAVVRLRRVKRARFEACRHRGIQQAARTGIEFRASLPCRLAEMHIADRLRRDGIKDGCEIARGRTDETHEGEFTTALFCVL
jgi:hypothetical protein